MSNPKKEPPFWNHILYKIPLVEVLRQNYIPIRDEICNFIGKENPLKDYPLYYVKTADEYDNGKPATKTNLIYEKEWKAMPYTLFEDENDMQTKKYPYFAEYTKFVQSKIPLTYNLIKHQEANGFIRNGFVSKLVPGSKINPHRGVSNKYLRLHLCLKTDLGCAITVGDETQKWYDGQFLAFKDGGPYLHSVYHEGTNERIILSMDLRLSILKETIQELNEFQEFEAPNA